jgi:hypothetical protein
VGTAAATAIRCGPGSRVAILLGEPQHDVWCTDHQNAAIMLVHRRQTHLAPLPACPSDLLFGRYGEASSWHFLNFIRNQNSWLDIIPRSPEHPNLICHIWMDPNQMEELF